MQSTLGEPIVVSDSENEEPALPSAPSSLPGPAVKKQRTINGRKSANLTLVADENKTVAREIAQSARWLKPNPGFKKEAVLNDKAPASEASSHMCARCPGNVYLRVVNSNGTDKKTGQKKTRNVWEVPTRHCEDVHGRMFADEVTAECNERQAKKVNDQDAIVSDIKAIYEASPRMYAGADQATIKQMLESPLGAIAPLRNAELHTLSRDAKPFPCSFEPLPLTACRPVCSKRVLGCATSSSTSRDEAA